MGRNLVIGLLLCLFISYSVAIYEDEIGVNNWHLKNIGRVNSAEYVFRDKIFVTTDNSIIALLERNTGEIVWRQQLPNNEVADEFYINEDQGTVITITKDKGHIYNWKLRDGGLLWENEYSKQNRNTENSQAIFYEGQTLLILNNRITLQNDFDGSLIWESTREYGEILRLVKLEKSIISISKINNRLSFTELDLKEGKAHKEKKEITIPSDFLYSIDSHYLSFVNENSVTVVDLNSLSKYDIPLEGEYITSIKSNSSVIVLKSQKSTIFIQLVNGQHKIHRVDNSNKYSFTVISKLASPLVISSPIRKEGDTTLDLEIAMLNIYKNSIEKSKHSYSIEYNNHHNIEEIFCNSLNDCLLVMNDHALYHISDNKIQWKREEALASINFSQIVDIPPPISPLEKMLRKESSNLFDRFINRIEGEFLYFVDKITHFNDHQVFDHDQFGYHKIILAITNNSKLYAIPSQSPDHIIWQLYLPSATITNLYCSHSSPNTCYLTTIDSNNRSIIYSIDVFTGESQKDSLSFELRHVILLENSPSSHHLLLIDSSSQAHLYPQNDEQITSELLTYLKSVYYYNVDYEQREIIGYSIGKANKSSFDLQQIWQISFPNEEIISQHAVQQHNAIFSPIRIVGSQTLEKYINQNLLAIGTLTQSIKGNRLVDSSIAVYLIDTVTGSILYRTHVYDAAGPLNILISENWVSFTYQNIYSSRFEISVIELFRDKIYWDDQQFSSFQQNEISIKQLSFELPIEITTIAVTATRLGISPRSVLMGTIANQVINVDGRLLDSLRQFPKEEPIEGLIPYYPSIRLYDRSFLSYDLEVYNIVGITSAPTDLESTTVILAYGTDLFFTHMQPADAFDILSTDFDHVTLLLIVGSLTVFAIISSRMSNNRDLMKKWA